jgi:hypothetical protein
MRSRRYFLASAATLILAPSLAAQSARAWRIGYLAPGNQDDPPFLQAFLDELRVLPAITPALGSHPCAWASFRQSLAGLPRPYASDYPDDVGSSHSGVPPHDLPPMSGVHIAPQRTRNRGPSLAVSGPQMGGVPCHGASRHYHDRVEHQR